MENKSLEQMLNEIRERNDIKASGNYGTTWAERATIELLDENSKATQALMKSITQFNMESSGLSEKVKNMTRRIEILTWIYTLVSLIMLVLMFLQMTLTKQ